MMVVKKTDGSGRFARAVRFENCLCLIFLSEGCDFLALVEEHGDAFVYAAEAHEGEGQEACGDEGDGHAVHAFGYAHEAELLTQTGKDDEREGKAEGGGQSEDDAGEEVGLKTLGIVGALATRIATPRMQQLVVIKGRNTPNA